MKKAIVVAAALLAFASAATAQATRGFRVKIPCETQQSGTDTHIVLSCKTGDGLFAIEMLLIPAPKSREELFATAGEDIAKDLGARPRITLDISRDGKTGRDIVTDLPGQNLTERDQLWLSPYLLFKVKFQGATGTENAKAATEFLESFSASP